MTPRLRTFLAPLALAAALGAGPATAATEEYVPFVSDFPQPEERYVPFVTDFPRPAEPAARPAAGGSNWTGVPVEGLGLALAALAAGLALARRGQTDPRLGGC